MLTYREEIHLQTCREVHLACLLGWVTALTFAFVCVVIALCDGPAWLLKLALADLLIGFWFFLLGRRPLRRVRELEEFV